MGVSHSMDREQVDEVLTQFEATTSSITGIEKKMEKVSQYMETVQVQRRALVVHAEVTTSLIDGLGESMADQSKLLYDYFATSFEHFAGLVEVLETSLYNLKLEDAPRQIQREFGPLLMPSVVLVFIITVSNCYFGFLLAGDESLAEALRNGIFLDGNGSRNELEARQGDRNILFLFATAHVVLIGLAIVYIAIDLLRRHLKARLKARRKSRISLAGQFFSAEDDSVTDESELEDPGTKSGAEVSAEAGEASETLRSEYSLRQSQATSHRQSQASSYHRQSQASSYRQSHVSSRGSRSGELSSRRSGTPVSGLLRRIQHVAIGRVSTNSSEPEVRIKGIFGLGSASRSSVNRPTQEWIGLCRIRDTQVVVRVAATSTSTVICTVAHGKRIMVEQAIRGGKGKIWGRISNPVAGWVLLADQQNGYKAVSKANMPPSPVPVEHAANWTRSESPKTLSGALRSMASGQSHGSRDGSRDGASKGSAGASPASPASPGRAREAS